MTIIRKYNSLLPDYLDRFFGRDFDQWDQWTFRKPAVNILERDDDYMIEVAAPGYEKKDFTVKVHNDELTISAKVQPQKLNGYIRKEFTYGDFKRTFTLDDTVDSDKIDATYTNGVLYVSVPKKEEAKVKPPKAIEIK